MDVIKTVDLRKSYGDKEVLHGISLAIAEGKLVGFLGPNGAGKTTAIRILMGLIRRSSGLAELLGRDAWQRGPVLRQDVGYLPGEARFYSNLTGAATLNFLAAARKLDCRQEMKRLSDVFDLDLSKKVRKYSSGMKQKLGIIAAMMHQPKLLVLDEPTSGLDPLVRKSVFSELRRFVDHGRTVLFSSHALSEVEELSEEVIILRDGQVIEQAAINTLRARALRRVSIAFESRDSIPDKWPRGLQITHNNDSTVESTWVGKIDVLIAWLHRQSILDVTIEQPDLEDLFMAYYSGGVDSEAGDEEVRP